MNIYDLVITMLPRHPTETRHKIWVNSNDEIMCKEKEKAYSIADFFEELGYDIIHVHYYEDEEYDGLNYGWYSVYVDGA